MNVGARHFYRFRYLRSEHWSNLRLQKLAETDARCFHCGKRDLSNDVHHLIYRRLYDVTTEDLIVLCREDHDLYHEVLAEHKDEINAKEYGSQRAITTMMLIREMRGQTLVVRHHFNERHERIRQEWIASRPKPAPKPQVVLPKKTDSFNWKPLFCHQCQTERIATTIHFETKERESRHSQICLSCWTVFLALGAQTGSLFRYARQKRKMRVPLLAA